jgi:hypothetical protein
MYQIRNLINDKLYIGYTKQEPISYIRNHFRRARLGEDPNKLLFKAILKYGEDAFEVTLIAQTTEKANATYLERFFIGDRNSHAVSGHGYNLTLGGDGGDTSQSPNYKAGIAKRDLRGEKNGNWGGFSEDHKKNLSAAKRGKRPKSCDVWSKAATGKIYLHDAIKMIEKRVHPDEATQFKNNGFVLGRLKLECKICGKYADVSNLKRHHRHDEQ